MNRSLALNLLSLTGTVCAAAIWYLMPEAGAWPLILVLLPWGIRLILQRRLFYRTPYDWALLLFMITAGLSVWAAYDRDVALAKFWTIVAGVALFYAFSNWTFDDERAARWLSQMLVFLGAGVAIYFLSVHPWSDYPDKFASLTRLGLFLQAPVRQFLPGGNWHPLHPNVAGGIMAFTVPVAGLVAWWYAKRRKWASFAFFTLLLLMILFGLLMSRSRGAWLAVACAIGLASWWFLVGLLTRKRPENQRWLFIGGLLAVAILFLTALLIRPEWSRSILQALPSLGETNRLDLYRDSLALVQDYPLIGAGLDLFMMLHASYVLFTHVGFSVHSHNLYLDLAIEQGLPGLFALFWLWGIFGLILWQVSGASGNHFSGREDLLFHRLAAFVAGLSLVTIAVHGLIDDAFYGSRAVILIFLPLSFSTGKLLLSLSKAVDGAAPLSEAAPLSGAAPLPQGGPVTRPVWRTANLLAGGALLGALLLLAIIPAGRSYWLSNLAAINQSKMELSVYSWPQWPIQDELRRQLDIQPVINGMEKALALNSHNNGANRRLGQIALSLGQYEQALGYLQTAYQDVSWDNATRQLLGEALIANGRVAEGAELWRTVNNNQSQLGIRLFWYKHIGDLQRLAWVEEGIKGTEPSP